MCGECTQLSGLHVLEDLVHLDVYDPHMQSFVPDGECGRGVLTTLLPAGGKCGMLLINYDTEDTTVVLSRERCGCGRTHIRIYNPARGAETVWVHGIALNRIDIESAIFQPENMAYFTGKYEAFLYDGDQPEHFILRISVEYFDSKRCDRRTVENRLTGPLLKIKPGLSEGYHEQSFEILLNFTGPGGDLRFTGSKGGQNGWLTDGTCERMHKTDTRKDAFTGLGVMIIISFLSSLPVVIAPVPSMGNSVVPLSQVS